MRDKKENLMGRVFGKLTVVRFDGIRNGKTFWVCLCPCGKDESVRADALKSGRCSCSTCSRADGHERAIIDLIGKRFGRLRVIKRSKKRGPSREVLWFCRCRCGKIVKICGSSLRSGHAKSCGCFHSDVSAVQAELMGLANRTHGASGSREYQVWHGMNQRCNGTADRNQHYHGRGIRVCKRWRCFENFLMDMGKRPTPRHQIDRIDVNGNYEPKNCRWVLPKEQQRNRRNNIPITLDGKTQCLAAWAEERGLTTIQLWDRIQKMGWPVREALTFPVAKTTAEKKRYAYLRTK